MKKKFVPRCPCSSRTPRCAHQDDQGTAFPPLRHSPFFIYADGEHTPAFTQLTLSAAHAAQAKNSSLYKSAGGALSSLLNTLVDESYYSRGSDPDAVGGGGSGVSASPPPSPSPLSNAAVAGDAGAAAGRRCAIAELGSALAGAARGGRRSSSSLRALGLARTGLTDRDAGKLAAKIRNRPADSPLEEVEVRAHQGNGTRVPRKPGEGVSWHVVLERANDCSGSFGMPGPERTHLPQSFRLSPVARQARQALLHLVFAHP